MRIITGKLKGRALVIPEGSITRPTTDRVKESIFSMVEVRKGWHGMEVLDLFAGSGSLGFEAISRGAERVVFVEHHRGAALQLEKTARQFGVDDQSIVVSHTVELFLKQPPRAFDLVLADPPYEYPFMQRMVSQILENGWLKPDGWFILEHDTRHAFLEDPRCISSRPYGRTIVSVMLPIPPAQDETEEPDDDLADEMDA